MMFSEKFRRNALRGLAFAMMMAPALGAMAVTHAEMEEARAITGKYYIRYINNGSGYLDSFQPKTMDELQKKLTNNTDRENFKKFQSVPTPTDYASWDKAKLADYWSNLFFKENAASLNNEAAGNGQCKSRIKAAIEKMTVAAPAPQAEAAPEAQEDATEDAALAEAQTADSVDQELANVDAEIQEAQNLVAQEEAKPMEHKNSGTWVYIMILAILVGVVIFLVVYASKTMKGQPKPKQAEEEYEEEEEPLPAPRPQQEKYTAVRQAVADDSRMREKYAEALAAKAEEIRSLNRQLADMEALAAGLKEENRKLTDEVDSLRKRLAASQPSSATHRQYMPRQEAERNDKPAPNPGVEPKEIYLGRVNSKGIFVRADRRPVEGQSIFKLTTADGVTGTYSLIMNPLIEEQVLDDPGKWLAGGCFAKDIFDTDGKEGISMETPGKAVFSDGAWRVERKAKIRYL